MDGLLACAGNLFICRDVRKVQDHSPGCQGQDLGHVASNIVKWLFLLCRKFADQYYYRKAQMKAIAEATTQGHRRQSQHFGHQDQVQKFGCKAMA